MGAVVTIPVCRLSTLTFSLVFFQLTSRALEGFAHEHTLPAL